MAKRGLVVIVAEYMEDSGITSFKDSGIADKLKLTMEDRCGYSLEIVNNPNRRDFLDKINEFFDNSNDDELFFYFCGHAKQDLEANDPMLHFACHDSTFGKTGTYLAKSELTKLLDKNRRRKVIAILDCCSAGTIDSTGLGKKNGSRPKENAVQNVFMIYSAYPHQSANLAKPPDTIEGPIFTHFFIDGFENDQAYNKTKRFDGQVNLNDLFNYAKENTVALTKKGNTYHPQIPFANQNLSSVTMYTTSININSFIIELQKSNQNHESTATFKTLIQQENFRKCAKDITYAQIEEINDGLEKLLSNIHHDKVLTAHIESFQKLLLKRAIDLLKDNIITLKEEKNIFIHYNHEIYLIVVIIAFYIILNLYILSFLSSKFNLDQLCTVYVFIATNFLLLVSLLIFKLWSKKTT